MLPKTSPIAKAGLSTNTDDKQVISSGNAVIPANTIPPITATEVFDDFPKLSAKIESLILKITVKIEKRKNNIIIT